MSLQFNRSTPKVKFFYLHTLYKTALCNAFYKRYANTAIKNQKVNYFNDCYNFKENNLV